MISLQIILPINFAKMSLKPCLWCLFYQLATLHTLAVVAVICQTASLMCESDTRESKWGYVVCHSPSGLSTRPRPPFGRVWSSIQFCRAGQLTHWCVIVALACADMPPSFQYTDRRDRSGWHMIHCRSASIQWSRCFGQHQRFTCSRMNIYLNAAESHRRLVSSPMIHIQFHLIGAEWNPDCRRLVEIASKRI